jgi:hypothetical protein
VQTGAEFRCATLAEVTQWMAEQNLRCVSDAIKTPSAPNTGGLEDLQ